jgi:hypothetical protein
MRLLLRRRGAAGAPLPRRAPYGGGRARGRWRARRHVPATLRGAAPHADSTPPAARRPPQAKNGTVHRGVFAGATLEPKNFGVTLRCVTSTPPKASGAAPADGAAPAARPLPSLVLAARDFSQL